MPVLRTLRASTLSLLVLLLAACATSRPKPAALPAAGGSAWDARMTTLQHAHAWGLAGRAAVALGAQGWQASLNWRQRDAFATVHLAGPLGVGATTLEGTPQGVSVNGAPPNEAALAEVQAKLGFALPLDDLRYWLLGVPNPAAAFEVTRNAQDRAATLTQDGWTLSYDSYAPFADDQLPARITMTRAGVRVRILIEHWEWY